MDIELDKPGDPHWLSKPVCECVLDRHAFRQYARFQTLNYAPVTSALYGVDRSLPTYTPIAKLCPLHASAPELLKALSNLLANQHGAESVRALCYEEARALVQRVREAHS